MAVTWLSNNKNYFPPLEQALPDGLLAAGGDLSVERLLSAYQKGIFPWFNKNNPILWWSPDPRMVLYTDSMVISKSLRKTIRKQNFTITFDTAFNDVMTSCSLPRPSQDLPEDDCSWIHPEMIAAYNKLHELGYAHSVECWQDTALVGGLYGISIGKMFFGESMFSKVSDSSKVALATLCQQLSRWNMPLIDCQVHSDHLASLGALEIPRPEFISHLNTLIKQPPPSLPWVLDADIPML